MGYKFSRKAIFSILNVSGGKQNAIESLRSYENIMGHEWKALAILQECSPVILEGDNPSSFVCQFCFKGSVISGGLEGNIDVKSCQFGYTGALISRLSVDLYVILCRYLSLCPYLSLCHSRFLIIPVYITPFPFSLCSFVHVIRIISVIHMCVLVRIISFASIYEEQHVSLHLHPFFCN